MNIPTIDVELYRSLPLEGSYLRRRPSFVFIHRDNLVNTILTDNYEAIIRAITDKEEILNGCVAEFISGPFSGAKLCVAACDQADFVSRGEAWIVGTAPARIPLGVLGFRHD